MVAAEAVTVALPLAEKGIQASVDLAKSLGAQISLALRSPLIGWEMTETRTTRKGEKTIRRSASLPAWAAVAGGLLVLAYAKDFGEAAPPSGAVWHWFPPGFY